MKQIALLMLLLCASSSQAQTSARRTFFGLVAALDAAEPLNRARVERLIGKPLVCESAGDCMAKDVALDGVTIGSVDFRGTGKTLLILDDLTGSCVDADRLVARYPAMGVTQACTDGATCLYYEIERRWGQMSIGIPALPAAQCATSVIFDTTMR